MSVIARLDRFQRHHGWVGLPLGVLYKFFDDRGPYLAALITYYAFVSLFPLLLLFFSAAGFFLQGHPELQNDLRQAVLKELPDIGSRIHPATFHGSGIGLAVGILGTLYGGLGATQAAQASFNQIYGVPRNEQPNPLKSRLRSLALLALLGSGVLLSTGIAVVLSTANGLSRQIGPAVHVAGYVLNYGVDFALFGAAFQLLIAAGLYMLIQIFGSSYVSHEAHASVYGVFAVVLGTLAWMYLQSLILILAAEINVVQDRHLWPRSLLTPFTDNVELTAADRRVYAMYASTQRFKGFERVRTEFGRRGPDEASAGGERDGGHRDHRDEGTENQAAGEPAPLPQHAGEERRTES